jgi:arylformamidase
MTSSPRRLTDLSHRIEHGMTNYPGLPGPVICDFWSRADSAAHYSPGTSFQIGKVELVANTGTYVDAPFHRYADGIDIADLSLQNLADLDTLVVRHPAEQGRAIDHHAFAGLDIRGRAVLIATGWARHWRTAAYFDGHPYLTRDAAQLLTDRGALLVGIDSLNIDDTRGGDRPVHTILLGAGIPIAEHLAHLDTLPTHGARFHAVPAPVVGIGSFPVRAYALLPSP